MALLVDHMCRSDRWRKLMLASDTPAEMLWMVNRHVPVFEVSNVANYIAENGPDYAGLASFPNVGPPHIMYWMEWARPERLMGDAAKEHPPRRIGLLFWQQGASVDGVWPITVAAFALWRAEPSPQCVWSMEFHQNGHPAIVTTNPMKGSAKDWYRDRPIELGEMPPVPQGLTLDEARDRLARLNQERDQVYTELDKCNDDLDRAHAHMLELTVLYPALMAHSFLACRNVELDEHHPPVKLSRNHERKHGEPMVLYKTLRIQPTGGAGHDGGSGDGLDRRLHIVRGHFKTFTVERPLFGRRVGTYWWTPRLRGKAERGTVIKDYEVAV